MELRLPRWLPDWLLLFVFGKALGTLLMVG